MRLRNLKVTLIILTAAVYCTGATLSALYYSGGNMNLVMTMLPPVSISSSEENNDNGVSKWKSEKS